MALLLVSFGAPEASAQEGAAAAAKITAAKNTAAGIEAAEEISSEDALEAAWAFADGKLLADAGDFEKALESYEKAVSYDPRDPYILMEVARFHTYLAQISRTRQQQTSYLEEALLYVDRARKVEVDNVDVLELFAQIHMRLAEEKPISLALAQGAWESLLELDPDNLGALTSLGQIYLWNQEGQKAADVLGEAARYSPRNRMIQSMLVEALLGTGKTEDAERALEVMVRLEPENVEHRIRLAELFAEKGDHAAAVEVLEAAPEDEWFGASRVDQLLAREYHLAGENEKALKLTDRILARSVGSVSSEGFLRLRSAILGALLRYQEAIETFLPLLANIDDPTRRMQDMMLVARLYERIGETSKAVDLMRAEMLVSEGESRARLVLALAGTHQRAGDLAEARTLLEGLGGGAFDAGASTIAADSAALVSQALSEILYDLGETEEALAALERGAAAQRAALDGAPDSKDANTEAGGVDATAEEAPGPDHARLARALDLRRAVMLSELEQWSAVEALARQALTVDSPGLQLAARQFLADALAGQGQLDEALELVEPAADEPSARQLRAKRYQLLFEHDQSETARRELADLVPPLAELEKSTDGADTEADPAVDAQPSAAPTTGEEPADPATTTSAAEEGESGGGEAGEGEADPALLAEQEEALDQVFFVAQILQRHEHYADAIPLLERIVDARPTGLAALFALGASYERNELRDKAADTFERLLELRPSHPPTLNYLGYMWAEEGENLERALTMIRIAVAADPDNGAYVDSLGWVYYQLGRYEDARSHLEWASSLEPDDPTVFEHLGDLYVALGETGRARRAYTRALTLYREEGADDDTRSIERKLAALDGVAEARVGAMDTNPLSEDRASRFGETVDTEPGLR